MRHVPRPPATPNLPRSLPAVLASKLLSIGSMRRPMSALVLTAALALSGCRGLGSFAGGLASGIGKVGVGMASGLAKAAPAIASGVGKGLAQAVPLAARAAGHATVRVATTMARATTVDYQRAPGGRIYIYDVDGEYEPIEYQPVPQTVWGPPPAAQQTVCWCVFRRSNIDVNGDGWEDASYDPRSGVAMCPDFPVTQDGQPYLPPPGPDGGPPSCPVWRNAAP